MAITFEKSSAKFQMHFPKDTETFSDLDPNADDETLYALYNDLRKLYVNNAESSSKVITYGLKTNGN